MPAIGNITLNDGKTTPVAHTFSPVSVGSDGVAAYVDRIGGIPIGYPRISLWLGSPSKTNRNYKFVAKVVLPVLEVTSPSTATGIQPAPTKAYDVPFTVTGSFPERSSLADRKDAVAYLKNILASAVVTAIVENLETIY